MSITTWGWGSGAAVTTAGWGGASELALESPARLRPRLAVGKELRPIVVSSAQELEPIQPKIGRELKPKITDGEGD